MFQTEFFASNSQVLTGFLINTITYIF